MIIIGEIGIMLYKIEILKFFNDFVLVVFILIKCDFFYLN